ncbi:MAG: radical SAM/SPASM domain-containing protein [Spirochaetia bacterium]
MNQDTIPGRIHTDIKQMFRQTLSLTRYEPAKLLFLIKLLFRQRRAFRLRRAAMKRGIEMPAFLIISVTNRCNLNCAGCYSKGHNRNPGDELTTEELKGLLQEAVDLGVSIVILAGGEPFTRKDLFDITGSFPQLLFAVFTNGMLLTDTHFSRIRKQKNVIPVFSIEGEQEDTDNRRGTGVHDKVLKLFSRAKQSRLFYGASFTATSANFSRVTDPEFLDRISDAGCRVVFFVEYVPIQEETEYLVLSEAQRFSLSSLCGSQSRKNKALYYAFPGDEERFGGCLAAGRGFIHVSADGSLEPCPLAPFSDANIRNGGLEKALRSKFLHIIRKEHHMLKETAGGCALWANREWTKQSLTRASKSRSTPSVIENRQ